MIKQAIFYSTLILLSFSCSNVDESNIGEIAQSSLQVDSKENQHFANSVAGLDKYWYQGKAEINRFTLEQNRYQDIHPGELVMVFVTEDFLTDKQVKNDTYQNPNSTPILKNNIMRKFPTGIYDYSIMTSVFTPVETKDFPYTLKLTASSQEWCGQTFMQLNYKKRGYEVQLNSYFENEGDQSKQVPHAILEEELFNRIRMNPEALPIGEFMMLPSTTYIRLSHKAFIPMKATASLNDYTGSDFEGTALKSYKVKYPDLNRTVEIVFENKSPYKITGWKDSYPSAFDKKIRHTIAKRTHLIMSDYWQKNSLSDMELRESLGTSR